MQEKPGHGHLWAGPIPLGSSRLSGTGWDFGGARAALCTLTELSESSGGTCRHQRDPCRGGDPSEQPGSPRSSVAEGFVALLYGTHAPCADPRAPAPTAAPWPPSSEPGGDVAVHTARKRPPLHQEKTGGCSIPGAWDVQKPSGRCRAWLRQGHRLGATAPCTQARLVSDAHAHQKAPLNQSGDRERGGKQPQGLGAHCRDRHGDRVGGSSHI